MRIRWINGIIGLLLLAPLFAGCEDRQREEIGSQPPPGQSQPNAPPMLGQSGSEHSPSSPEQEQPEHRKEEKTATDKTPEERG